MLELMIWKTPLLMIIIAHIPLGNHEVDDFVPQRRLRQYS